MGEKVGTVTYFLFLGSKIIANSISAAMKLKDTCSWKKSYDRPRQHIKKQRHYFADKGPHSQNYGFSVVMYGCENWTIKKAEHQRIDIFELWCWRRLLRAPWTAKRSNQSILKEINPEYSLEGLMLKLACCSPWGHKESDMTEWLNNNKMISNLIPYLCS